MAKILDLPKLSPTMEEGVLSKWWKKQGDSYEVDDLLAEVETDKATMEFRAFEKGVILKILVEEGSTVKLGGQLALVGLPGETPAEAVIGVPPRPVPPPDLEVPSPPALSNLANLVRTELLPPEEPQPTGSVIASPRVRKDARDRNIDLSRVKGSGEKGRILLEDLREVSPVHLQSAPSDDSPERVQLSPMRKTIARRLVESKQNIPHFYLTVEVDVSRLLEARTQLVQSLNNPDLKPTINDFIVLASSKALALNPQCNVSYDDGFVLKHRVVNTSVAVAIPDGLVTPVIRGSDKLSILQVHREIKRLAELAKGKKLKPEEMQGGTYSVSNLGSYGISEFSAVINPPEGFILAIGGAGSNGIMKITMSCDHRVIDGAVGAGYLKDLKRILENPMLILI